MVFTTEFTESTENTRYAECPSRAARPSVDCIADGRRLTADGFFQIVKQQVLCSVVDSIIYGYKCIVPESATPWLESRESESGEQ